VSEHFTMLEIQACPLPNRDRPCRKPAQEPLSGRDRVSLVCTLGGILRAFAVFAPQDPNVKSANVRHILPMSFGPSTPQMSTFDYISHILQLYVPPITVLSDLHRDQADGNRGGRTAS
jgi:hypothetical protein